MGSGTYTVLLFMLLLVFIMRRQQKNYLTVKLRRKRGSRERMVTLAKEFIGKECIIDTFHGTPVQGVIQQVSEGAVLVECAKFPQAVNLDFVVRIREYPRNKRGKKKTLVLD